MKPKVNYESEIIEVIKTERLFVIQDIFAFYTKIKSSQFYNLGLEKSEGILKAIDDNKVKTKHSLKEKWYKSDNPTLQIALMKLIATDDERKAMSLTYGEHSVNVTEKKTLNELFPFDEPETESKS